MDRIAADEPYYGQKHKRHGINVQVIAAPDGTLLWLSRALPGRPHELTAARAHGILQACLTRQILAVPDRPGEEAAVRPGCLFVHGRVPGDGGPVGGRLVRQQPGDRA